MESSNTSNVVMSEETLEEIKRLNYYINEGLVIACKGKMILAVNPDVVNHNLKALATGEMKIDWEIVKQNIDNSD